MPLSRGTVLLSSFTSLSSDAQDRRNALEESLTLAESSQWEFAADYQDDHVELGSVIPTFPATRTHIPNTLPAEKINVLELLDEDMGVDPGTPYAWIEGFFAQSIVGIVILLNAIIIGLETDNRSFNWAPVEHAFLTFFVGELYFRLMLHGLGFFAHVGSVFDFFVCASGVMDIWILPLCTLLAGGALKKSSLLQALQLLRLLRIVRLIRLVKIIRPLYSLALGIAEALQGMVWVVVFLFMTFYAASILTARLLGLPEDGNLEGISKDDVEVRVLFNTVLTSMFTLFESITCWSLMRFGPLFERMPGLRIIAVFFYMLMNWALLAVLTGVVSEKIMAVKEQLRDTNLENGEDGPPVATAIDDSEQLLHELFRRADTDGSGSISREEFNAMLLCSDVMKPLMQQSQLDAQDLGELFNWLDHDKDGVITVQEFMQGFHLLVADINPKGLLKLEEELRCKIQHLRNRLLRKVHTSFDNFMASVSIPLRKITAVSEQIQRLDKVLDAVKKSTDELQGKIENSSLDATERQLMNRLDELGRAVDLLEKLQQRGLVELDEALLEDDEEMKITRAMSEGGVMKRSSIIEREQQQEKKTVKPSDQELIFFEPEEDDWRDDLSETAPDQQEFLPPGIGKASTWMEKKF